MLSKLSVFFNPLAVDKPPKDAKEMHLVIVSGIGRDDQDTIEDGPQPAGPNSCTHAARLVICPKEDPKTLLSTGLPAKLTIEKDGKLINCYIDEPIEYRNYPIVTSLQHAGKPIVFLICPDDVNDLKQTHTHFAGLGINKQKDRAMVIIDLTNFTEIKKMLEFIADKRYFELVPHFWETGLGAVYQQYISPVPNPSKEILRYLKSHPHLDKNLAFLPQPLVQIIKDYLKLPESFFKQSLNVTKK